MVIFDALSDSLRRSVQSPDESTTDQENADDIETLLGALDPRERNIIEYRFGLADGRERTLAGIPGETCRRESIRQIQNKALRKLRRAAFKIIWLHGTARRYHDNLIREEEERQKAWEEKYAAEKAARIKDEQERRHREWIFEVEHREYIKVIERKEEAIQHQEYLIVKFSEWERREVEVFGVINEERRRQYLKMMASSTPYPSHIHAAEE